MEKSQIKHIKNNLQELVKKTTYSSTFIEMFVSRNVLDINDVKNLDLSDLTSSQKCEKLYEILTKRPGSFDVLIQLLERTQQKETLKLLLSCDIFCNYGTISHDKNKVLRNGRFSGDKIYHGNFGGRNVAVKVVNADIMNIKLTLREVKMLEKLDEHENILRYFTVEVREGFIQTAFELFEITLQDAIKGNMTVNNMNPVKILTECTTVLAYIHSMNVIHSDLNPANILLKRNNQVKICNFGLAQQITAGKESIAAYTENIRNKNWMAPELLKHFAENEADTHLIEMSTACDVFSLGCIFYFVLTEGAHPFGSSVLRQSNIYYGKPQMQNSSFLTFNYQKSNLAQLILKMISHAPRDRPSAKDILMDSCIVTDIFNSTPDRNTFSSHNGNVGRVQVPACSAEYMPIQFDSNLNGTSSSLGSLVSAAKRPIPSEQRTSFQGPCSSSEAKKKKTCPQIKKIEKIQSASVLMRKVDDIDEGRNNALFRAVLKGKNLQEIKSMVENGSNVKYKTSAEESVLDYAMNHKDPEVVKFLISAGADVNSKDSFGESPIHKLKNVWNNFKEKLTILIENGADINTEDAGGNTILGLVASAGRSKANLEFIIGKSGNWKRKNKNGETTLHLAVDGGNITAIKYLIEVGCKLNVRDKNGKMPIHRVQCTKQNFKGVLDTLLDHGTNIKAIDKDGNSVLALAAEIGRSKEDLEYIIKKGGDRQAKNGKGQSILHAAAKGGNPQAIKYLIGRGALVNLNDRNGEVPLHQIALTKLDFWASLNVLLKYGADINEQNEMGNTLLGMSTLYGRPGADLKYIVEKGGNWKLRNALGESLVHLAAEGGNVEAIQFFVSLGLPIDLKSNQKQLPLHYVVDLKRNFKETADVLLAFGTNINATDKNGDTLLGLATWNERDKEILEYLINRGANWKERNNEGLTILHMAARGGNVEVIKYIIEELGENVNARDNNGFAPLHLIAYTDINFKQCLDEFLKHGAKINATNNKGCTLLDLAVKKKWQVEVLEYVVSKGGTGTLYEKMFG